MLAGEVGWDLRSRPIKHQQKMILQIFPSYLSCRGGGWCASVPVIRSPVLSWSDSNLKWSRCVQIMSILARITIKTCSDLFAECVIRVTETPHVQTLSDFLNVSFVFWSQCQPDISHRILIKSFQNRNCIINYYRWWNLYITAAL